ncbi:MAG: hypothetical protein UV61_C0002G0275 [Candidatus Gottesmanbacteria bacterium GW2011_GWB1_43_11]|uniref:Glycosyltransferase 2-like domain-containing protein n=1 Tax=Candidatus Gottesmanbacteria bacterium GW2011_GWB1_43_11 TaxID=1618446 RepID=A0A0G1CPS8_9BACT|nr:MAG: hypothetical protein UV04_C0001G0163 [Candidatus Gottesmanbacteria bacterium GW2011_GWA2_42_16]KKS55992.1 MAG: hypothetical protein UV17_C0004G0014 [Candidatus Gottesmanbacteria bacterium GW2011_GWA1_42_26]KKS87554.1 MAG: hypothetical protein UV61_C0002G0275 [Candidatus Gottesmanbacteria bacterium GW2011_GWB1_43_11]OGG10366.1 MAG: hypothetical protein A2699_00990 [Candidatus Gottesmanbacteria bacterium RIFCSPHIGHO2_01_FULL_43_15]HCM37722.1 hypothetical protein [Patescibacteria group bac
MDNTDASVVVVIVTFNNQETIAACLNSVLENKLTQVIVVDSASTDDTRELVRQKYAAVNLISLPNNVGFAAGNNLGIELALKEHPTYILILNPDTVLLPGALSALVAAAQHHHQRGIFGPQILRGSDPYVLWSAGGEIDPKRYTAGLIGYNQPVGPSFEKETVCDFVSGTCMLISAALFSFRIRFFAPYFLYYEDVEFCLWAKRFRGFSVYVPQAKILHQETSASGERLQAKSYYLARNHLLFVERCAPFGVKLRELARLPKTLAEHIGSQDLPAVIGIKDYFLRHFGHYENTKHQSRTQAPAHSDASS